MRTVAFCAIVAMLASPGISADMDSLPVDQWTPLQSGKPLANLHPRMVWLPQQKVGFMWLNVDFRTKAYNFEDHAKSRLFDPATGTWAAKPTAFGAKDRIRPEFVGQAIVYLPGINKVLLLMTNDPYSRGTEAASWLFDPAKDAWEAIGGNLSMADDPTKFGAADSQAGSRIPLWGTLVYDPLNREAVLIGGGATWGRIGDKPEKVGPGDWIHDEQAGRIRRLLVDEKPAVTQARKWYPANCGTWVFSEQTLKWTAIEQPLADQPPGRILGAAAYEPASKKIVLFGGDDYVRCLDDTWLYDCAMRMWKQASPKVSPPARAGAAAVAPPDAEAVLLAGGYDPAWQGLRDTWVYRTAENTWTKLEAELPAEAGFAGGDVDPASGAVLVNWLDDLHARRSAGVCAMKLDLKSAATAQPPAPVAAEMTLHCKAAKDWGTPPPAEWLVEKNAGPTPEAGRKELAELPANMWVLREPPLKARARQWGSYTYDARTHTVFAWGGGHYGYVGNEVNEYSVLTNRWRSQADPPAYKPRWWHGAGGGGGTGGVSFQGWRLMGIHARKSYAVDVKSNSMLTVHGDVYDLAHHMVVGNIGRCPGGYGLSQQECFLNTPHGLYAFGLSRNFGAAMHRADVAGGKWDLVAKSGPGQGVYDENDHVCYDSKRDRMIYFDSKSTDVWAFDFATAKWQQEEAVGGKPPRALGDSCYIPELDAAMMMSASTRGGPETLYFYRLGDRRWFTSPYAGKAIFSKTTGRDASPFYDPELKLIVRAAHEAREGWIDVLVLRLEAEKMELTPVGK